MEQRELRRNDYIVVKFSVSADSRGKKKAIYSKHLKKA